MSRIRLTAQKSQIERAIDHADMLADYIRNEFDLGAIAYAVKAPTTDYLIKLTDKLCLELHAISNELEERINGMESKKKSDAGSECE